jgi:hypothetical protein
MNHNEFLKREAEGVCLRADELDIYWQEEARRAGERRRRTDEADGYFEPLEDGED